MPIHNKTLESFSKAIMDYTGSQPHAYTLTMLKQLNEDDVEILRQLRKEDRANPDYEDDACVREMVNMFHLEEVEDLSFPYESLANYFNEDLIELEMVTRVHVRNDESRKEYWYIKLHPDEETWVQDHLNTYYPGITYLYDVQEWEDEEEYES